MIRVRLIEDNEVYRFSLEEELNALPGITVIASDSSMEAALDRSDECQNPDLFLVDIGLPGMSGLLGMEHLLKYYPDVKIMILTVRQDKQSVKQAICSGADGYLVKTDDISSYEAAIHEVVEGRVHLDPDIGGVVVQALRGSVRASHNFSLTAQELEVVRHLADGHTKKIIADLMNLSVHTVDGYLRHVYRKLEVHTVNGAVAKAIKAGLV